MVDNRLAGACTNIVGVPNSVGALWSIGGGVWLCMGNSQLVYDEGQGGGQCAKYYLHFLCFPH